MKANELMIGDWVQESNHGQKGKVTYLDANRDCSRIDIQPVDGGGYPCANDVIFPIPLTAEILEKNPRVKDLGYWDNKVGVFRLFLIPAINLWEVHRCQHALRLCGRDEMADNFKIS